MKYYGRKNMRKVRRNRRRRGSLAKRAFKLAKRIANHTEETKMYRRGNAADVNNGGAGGKFAIFENLTTVANGDTVLFDTNHGSKAEYILGNKYYHKRTQIRWEIHMDNVNNEEETVNFTVAVLSPRKDLDWAIDQTSFLSALSEHTDLYQGQAFFDYRFIKVHYYKHFTLTMGGTSPGTSGQMLKKGVFKKAINRMMRRTYDAAHLAQSFPVDFQDRLAFVVLTDNSAADTESPRINYSIINTIKDTDLRNVTN